MLTKDQKGEGQIKILHLVPTLGYGGVTNFLLNYYSKIDKRRIRFDFLTHGKTEEFHQKLKENGSKIFYFEPIHTIGIREYSKKIKEILCDNSYDIIHIHTGHTTGLLAFLCKRACKSKIISHAHTTQCANPNHRYFMFFFRILSRFFSDKLFACGMEAGKFCFGKTKFEVIHNAVDLNKFRRLDFDKIQGLKKRLEIPSHALVLGNVGAFITQKNHVFLLSILKKILLQKENVYMILVGDGPLIEDVKKKSKQFGIFSKIRFVGKQNNIPLYMSLFDVFLLPSLFEGLPVVSAEAQAIGLKCIFSNTIDSDSDAGLGLVHFLPINKNSIEAWVKLILFPYNKPNTEIITSAFKKTKYDINSCANYLEDEYLKIL